MELKYERKGSHVRQTIETRHILSAFFTFVALDERDKPVDVPEVIPETAEQKRRYGNAQIRRQGRSKTRKQLSSSPD